MAQKKRSTDELIADTEYLTAKIKFLKGIFPDLKVHDTIGGFINLTPTFSSSKVNSEYTDLEFLHGWNKENLRVAPYSLFTFEHNGKIEDIKVQSSPKASRLAYIDHCRRLKPNVPSSPQPAIITTGNPPWAVNRFASNYEHYKVLRFGRVKFNFKTNNFSEKMIDQCQSKIMEFVGLHSGVELDTKHLDSRLKKLLIMS